MKRRSSDIGVTTNATLGMCRERAARDEDKITHEGSTEGAHVQRRRRHKQRRQDADIETLKHKHKAESGNFNTTKNVVEVFGGE